ncbi:hypothetical protein HMI54_006155 [Coelomomyces lativittatus]|nr:hypothetical protein HMI54_006155 [Coelomomyces lativittatus]
MSISPGDIIYLKKGAKIPADLILLSSSFEDGLCYIETSELDGETALKRRSALQETQSIIQGTQLNGLTGWIQCELPNDNLNQFSGRCLLKKNPLNNLPTSANHSKESFNVTDKFLSSSASSSATSSWLALNMQQCLLRGAYLKNTEFCLGVVVYAGLNSKIFKNLKHSSLKFSTMEKSVNVVVMVAFFWNMIMLIVSIVEEGKQWSNSSQLSYIPSTTQDSQTTSPVYHYWTSFMTFFVIYTYTIPVSLFVIMEFIRLAQRQFMTWDTCMQKNQVPMIVNNSNVNEDLGRVQHVFSDKTGTLTCNQMILHQLCLGHQVVDCHSNQDWLSQFNLNEPSIKHMIRCILVCNTAVPCDDGTFESQSPDEVALLEGLRPYALLKKRTKKKLVIEENGQQTELECLHVIEFTSDRKRMTVIVRDETGMIRMYMKGADNMVLARLTQASSTSILIQDAERQISIFSEEGLRTLMFAYKDLTEEKYLVFHRSYTRALGALHQREEKLAQVADTWEVEFTFLGCSAIEDRLQEDVPATIDFLARCGIRLWLLTGDKRETAINIGYSAQLLKQDTQLLKLTHTSVPELMNELHECIHLAQMHPPTQSALVVQGDVLILIFEQCPQLFLKLCLLVNTVLCCRVAPLQKALMVRLVRRELRHVTLSIGDGANDVSMIQEADIGVGIFGLEGAQAVRASDYAFAEFRFLARLLCVHGRYSYTRLSNLIQYSFYKNIVFITNQFIFGGVCAWAGETDA